MSWKRTLFPLILPLCGLAQMPGVMMQLDIDFRRSNHETS